jgi:cytochrome c-type biogenesis protein CcmH/NrfG
MDNQSTPPASPNLQWRPLQVIALSAICLVVGLVLGYLLRGSAPTAVPAPAAMSGAPDAPVAATPAATTPAAGSAPAGAQGGHPQMTLDDMKKMADAKAAPELEKLKKNPKDAEALNNLGILYRATHQFKEAEGYYEKSLEINPKNVNARVDLASCLYYSGDADGAIAQLNKALTYDPKHPGALMNLGLIKWKAKNDVPGAVADWQKLLKMNPDFPQKDAVERMINAAEQSAKTQG